MSFMLTISEALAIAVQHHQCGRLQAAEQIYRRVLEQEPKQADALHLLGLIAHQTGNHEAAVHYIRRAIEFQGKAAFFHNDLGEAYQALRRTAEAVACYRRALDLNPDDAQSHYNLGNALKEQGKLDEAVACWRRAVNLKPDFVEAHNNLGNALNVQGKLDEALACFQRALKLKPDYAEAHSNLGVAFKDRGNLDEAVACCRRAVELNPDFAGAQNNLGAVLKEQGKLDEALAYYHRALELRPDYAEAHNNLGMALKEQGKPDEALACYRRALELRPDYAEAHGNLGNDLEEMGDLQGAEDAFRAALRHDPRFAFAHYKLAELLGGKLPEQDLAAQRRLLEQGSACGEQGALTDTQRMLLHFGLAQVLDARGAYAEAAEHSIAANALRLAQGRIAGQEYDPAAHSAFVNRIIAEFTPEVFVGAGQFGAGANGRSSWWACRDRGRPSWNRFWPATPRSSRPANRPWPVTVLPRPATVGRGPTCEIPAWTVTASRKRPSGTWRNCNGGMPRPSAWSTRCRTITSILDFWRPSFPAHGSSTAGATSRRGRIVLDDELSHHPLGERPRRDRCAFSRLSAADGLLARGAARAGSRSLLRRDRDRPGNRRPPPRGLVRPGMGARLLGVLSRPTGSAHGQQHPGPATALHDLRGKVAALRAIAGNALDRAAGGTED